MVTQRYIGVVDYVVIALSLFISAAIGIKFRFSGGRQRTTTEYLLAGKDMSKVPVILSITVTLLSGLTMLGNPAEVYRFGIFFVFLYPTVAVGTIITAYVFIPVYFQTGVSTAYEFLDIRYGKKTRYAVSVLFVMQMIIFMSIGLYAPALALAAFTNLSIEACITVIGTVCTFYCVVGGLKAILWTDAFQSILMYLCVIILFVQGIIEAGGVNEIYKRSLEGQRLTFYDFSLDLTLRYTSWGILFRGLLGSMSYFGTSQLEVQRMLSMKNSERAKSSLIWSSITTLILASMVSIFGLVMYAVFQSCDPVKDAAHTGVQKYDQIIPYYIVTRFGSIPGLSGLCMAGIFSGSLSSISSAVNSLSTVTVMDFLKPLLSSKQFTEKKVVFLAKLFSFFYGVICVSVAFALSKVDSLVAAGHTMMSALEGPVLAIFVIGVLTRKGSEECVLVGLFSGIALTCWISYGCLFGGNIFPSLPMNITGCELDQYVLNKHMNSSSACYGNSSCFATTSSEVLPSGEIFFMYRISFYWITVLGFIFTIVVILVGILLTGCKDVVPADTTCLSPVTRLWEKGLLHRKKKCQILTDDIILSQKIVPSSDDIQSP